MKLSFASDSGNGVSRLTDAIKRRARELGFELVGIAPVGVVPELSFYRDWVAAGYAGEMHYLTRDLDRRTSISAVVPEARSVIACAMVYNTPQPRTHEITDPRKGWISRYAWGDDYHDVLRQRLEDLLVFIRKQSREPVIGRIYVDTGPVVDRVVAKYAGIGWFGKNTCLLNEEFGSWFFLGEIITNLELDYDSPVPDRCGSCRRCIDACPTGALLEPYVLDSRRCISYLTIELRGPIPESLRPQMGQHVFGCDICQDVCPWNEEAPTTKEGSFQPRAGFVAPDLEDLAELDAQAFSARFRRNPIRRAKWRGLLRNVAVAMGNSGLQSFRPVLKRLSRLSDDLVAEHARWALRQLSAGRGNRTREEFDSAEAVAESTETPAGARIEERIHKAGKRFCGRQD